MKSTAIVTGASRGIGLAIAKKFASEGFQLIITARNAEGLGKAQLEIEQTYKVPCSAFVADLSDKKEVQKFAEFALKISKSIQVLVNNAGCFLPGSILTEEDDTFEQMISINLGSAYHLNRALVPQMIGVQRAHVFHIASTASITAYINGGSYGISKAGMLALSKVLREELKHHKIGVTAIMPGATLTDSWAGSDLPEDRFMKPEDIAEAVWYAYSINEHCVTEEMILRPHLGDIT